MACIFTIIVILLPEVFASIFANRNDSADLIHLVGRVMPVFMAGIWMFGIQMSCQSAFMGMGQAKISLFLALLRKIILLIPLALVLPNIFGIMGIYYAEPVADILAAITTGLMFIFNFKKILEKDR